MSRRSTKVRASVAVAAVGLGAFATAASADSGSGSSCPSAQVGGLSTALRAFHTGAAVGPSITYGVASTALTVETLPGPLGDAQAQVLVAGANGVEAISTQGPAAIDQVNQAISFLAVYNDYTNAFIQMGSSNLDALATQAGPVIAPFDRTLHQLANLINNTQEQEQTCGASIPGQATGSTPAGRIALAFVQGDGAGATELIKSLGVTADTKTLGEAVYLGGIAAVATNRHDEFDHAVAYALPHAGVKVTDASLAFGDAATQAVETGLTPAMGAVGGHTVTDTYTAYATGAPFDPATIAGISVLPKL